MIFTLEPQSFGGHRSVVGAEDAWEPIGGSPRARLRGRAVIVP
ncbi:hypothetical protein ACWDUL_04375 [Nocardia niigatensis]